MRHPDRQAATAALHSLMPLILGISFLLSVYIRFYSGWIPAEDRPAWPGYVAYFVLSVAVWSALEARRRLVSSCFEQSSLLAWLWALAQIEGLSLALVSSAAFFWRTYSFSRDVVAIFWGSHFLLCAFVALAARAWARSVDGSGAHLVLAGAGLSAERVARECLASGAAGEFRAVSGVPQAIEMLQIGRAHV